MTQQPMNLSKLACWPERWKMKWGYDSTVKVIGTKRFSWAESQDQIENGDRKSLQTDSTVNPLPLFRYSSLLKKLFAGFIGHTLEHLQQAANHAMLVLYMRQKVCNGFAKRSIEALYTTFCKGSQIFLVPKSIGHIPAKALQWWTVIFNFKTSTWYGTRIRFHFSRTSS